MEEELRFYSSGYKEMMDHNQQMRDEILGLRNILSGHKNCPMLVSAVGGFDQLTGVIDRAEYVAMGKEIPGEVTGQMTGQMSGPMSQDPVPMSHQVQPQIPQGQVPSHGQGQGHPQMTHLPPHLQSNLVSHHSMSDLPAAANMQQPQADIRAINSMSNLQSLNHQPENHVEMGNVNLRAVNSMMDLHLMGHLS